MADILQTIVDRTREDLPRIRRERTLSDFRGMESYHKNRTSLREALRRPEGIGILAEIKKASPSKGVLRDPFDPIKIADSYIANGASALSILTNAPFFQGSLNYLENISHISPIPLLRKDFIIDTHQVFEARAYGADAILLIVAILDDVLFSELLHAARENGLEVLVECDRKSHLDRIRPHLDHIDVVGVNNRDLRTFTIDLDNGLSILEKVPSGTVRISESGISTPDDLLRLHRSGINAALIGEAFMRADDPGKALKELLGQTAERIASNKSQRVEG